MCTKKTFDTISPCTFDSSPFKTSFATSQRRRILDLGREFAREFREQKSPQWVPQIKRRWAVSICFQINVTNALSAAWDIPNVFTQYERERINFIVHSCHATFLASCSRCQPYFVSWDLHKVLRNWSQLFRLFWVILCTVLSYHLCIIRLTLWVDKNLLGEGFSRKLRKFSREFLAKSDGNRPLLDPDTVNTYFAAIATDDSYCIDEVLKYCVPVDEIFLPINWVTDWTVT